jgi:hypothetical protein
VARAFDFDFFGAGIACLVTEREKEKKIMLCSQLPEPLKKFKNAQLLNLSSRKNGMSFAIGFLWLLLMSIRDCGWTI